MRWFRYVHWLAAGACLLTLAACGPGPTAGGGDGGAKPSVPAQPKVLTIGVWSELQVIGVLAGTSSGGWTTLTERDENTLFANVLAGSVDVLPEPALHAELAVELKDRWDKSGEGVVRANPGTTSFLAPQWRVGVQTEPANLDVRVRQALYQAIDRDAFPKNLVQQAWSFLPPGDRLYDATADSLRRYPYDPGRARAILEESGWTLGPDGILRNNVDGRRFQNRISTVTSGRLWEVATYADSWRRIGIEVQEAQLAAAQTRDLEFRALYPSWEASSSSYGDGIWAG